MNINNGMDNKFRTEVSDLMTKTIVEVYETGFKKGYEAGKLVGVVDSVAEINNKWLAERKTKTPNQQRAELIEKAKKFIEECKKDSTWGGRVYFVPMANGGQWICDVRFEVNASKRTIVALLFWKPRHYKKGVLKAKGIAKCMPGDVFNEHIGQAIALAKALQIDIPVEFLKAVQPSEIVIGMTVKNEKDFPQAIDGPISKGEIFKVVKDERPPSKGECQTNSVIAHSATIIDDTNAQYEVTVL
ncbi:hypothetical protein [Psychrobacillus sp. FSL K6-1267]|uniref:hypothetical protein n=1 Tax=Psychrobacillus sp. FSL K6-1267 TaxID=2921543 RepID=UPI0030F83A40